MVERKIKLMQQEITLQAEVIPSWRRRYFFRGSLFLFSGIGILLTAAFLFYIGLSYGISLLLFGAGLTFLWLGWSFFQKIAKMDFYPDEVLFLEGALAYKKENKVLFILPFSAISSVTSIHTKYHYGIGIFLKSLQKEKILIKEPSFDLLAFHKQSKKKYHCDLFLPFFSTNAYEELKEICTYLKQNLQFIHQGNLLSTESFLENIMHSEDPNNF